METKQMLGWINLQEEDPEVWDAIRQEAKRQRNKLELIASENYTSRAVLETLLEIAHLSEVAIKVDYSRLPIPQIVSRFAQAFQFDPLKMISSGALVATFPPKR